MINLSSYNFSEPWGDAFLILREAGTSVSQKHLCFGDINPLVSGPSMLQEIDAMYFCIYKPSTDDVLNAVLRAYLQLILFWY